ncbi:DNA translocase FtsK [Priestia koreensis]|uniref:FtsK domain-containing protein n=1 Tax=Priestia koreensis TaxID=284581 RepID=A0A0M0L6Z4_9BACI|nr:DNA translocase FtsK [Priestia koreensis]KOO46804.1 hypothetical protein AMD01_07735 [Priestia koreensis]
MSWIRKAFDYLLGYEVKEIIVDEEGREKEVPVSSSASKQNNPKLISEHIPKQKAEQYIKPVKTGTPLKFQEPEQKEQAGRDVQAKIAYQYPKGKFRFPLIADEEMEQQSYARSTQREKAEKVTELPERREYPKESIERERKVEVEELHKPRVQFEAPPQKEHQPKREMKVEKDPEEQRSHPFRPTEVPSPIYGFKQRPEQLTSSLRYSYLDCEEGEEHYASPYRAPRPVVPVKRAELTYEQVREYLKLNETVYKNFRPAHESTESQSQQSQVVTQEPRHEDTYVPEDDVIEFELTPSTDRGVREDSISSHETVDQIRQQNPVVSHSEVEEVFSKERPVPQRQEPVYNVHPVQEEVKSMQGEETLAQAPQPRVYREEPIVYEEEHMNLERPAYERREQQDINRPEMNEFSSTVQSFDGEELQAEPVRLESLPERPVQPVYEEERMIENVPVEQAHMRPETVVEAQREVAFTVEETAVSSDVSSVGEQAPSTMEVASDMQDAAEPAEEPRRKRFVPYNVMMLKKDRRQMSLHREADARRAEVRRQETVQEHVKREEVAQVSEETVLQPDAQLTSPLVETRTNGVYEFPSMGLLNTPPEKVEEDKQWLEEQRELLDMTLKNFNVRAKVVNVTQGPTVTRFEVHPEPGVKVNKITNLTDDIKLSLAARDIRIEAPIPGKNTIGIEVPNRQSKAVLVQEILQSSAFSENSSPLNVALGLDISGEPIVTDLKKMPHGLIAGATGSGKSVCINTIIVSLLYKAAPHEVKLMLIDPKMVELAPYNGIPHLVSPVITDAKAATAALKWAVEEMERRYELFAHSGVRDITKYNERVKQHGEKSGELPYLVIIIDELADLMMVAPGEVEEAICRIAQKARACGIHLLLATQRPSVDVITGLIKANVPTRVAFSVSSQVDSRTIIDTGGAEKLLGRGDMLFLENGSSKTVRIQGNFISDEEIDRVVDHVKKQMKPNYLFQQEDLLKKQQTISSDEDDLFVEACEFVLDQGGASTSSLQRHFRIGYNRAARLIDMMEGQGIISEARGSKPRDVLITEDDLTDIQSSSF